ncbi:glycosyltransferase family 2 protein [Actinoplanes sp. NPDC051633]|uniref:glycosyltransferase family 2 protein n=1 Tax=Actinoplanes sp. NPDC051633 TaxID=3155670 RepID=UPI003447A515
MTVLLLPVHTPTHQLPELIAVWAGPAVVVDDGSGPSASPVLQQATAAGATVLRHPVNKGKGAALKTGFRHIMENLPDDDVVCADGDGQHRLDDIRNVAAHVSSSGRMTLGVRSFDGEVPFRSRLGNRVTSRLVQLATGRYLGDTQTGLRAHPAGQIDWLLSIDGERFEYEMNVLLAAARTGRPIDEVTIATVYNGSSKFSPLADSARIYWPLLRAVAGQTPS